MRVGRFRPPSQRDARLGSCRVVGAGGQSEGKSFRNRLLGGGVVGSQCGHFGGAGQQAKSGGGARRRAGTNRRDDGGHTQQNGATARRRLAGARAYSRAQGGQAMRLGGERAGIAGAKLRLQNGGGRRSAGSGRRERIQSVAWFIVVGGERRARAAAAAAAYAGCSCGVLSRAEEQGRRNGWRSLALARARAMASGARRRGGRQPSARQLCGLGLGQGPHSMPSMCGEMPARCSTRCQHRRLTSSVDWPRLPVAPAAPVPAAPRRLGTPLGLGFQLSDSAGRVDVGGQGTVGGRASDVVAAVLHARRHAVQETPASRAAIPAAQARSQPRPCTRAHPAARP